MIKHVVMWKLKDHAEGHSKHENLAIMKNKLLALQKAIPAITSMEVGLNFNTSEAAADIVLITTHTDGEALQAYIEHPVHREAAGFIGKIASERKVVDFEID